MTRLQICKTCAKKETDDWTLGDVIGLAYCERCWRYTTVYTMYRELSQQPDSHLEAAYEERTDEP